MAIKFNKETFKKTYEQGQKTARSIKHKTEEFIQKVDMAINPPKLDVLRNNKTESEKEYLLQEAKTKFAKSHCRPGNTIRMAVAAAQEKELIKAYEKAKNAVDAYNKFKSKQDAAQAAFDRLNGLNK